MAIRSTRRWILLLLIAGTICFTLYMLNELLTSWMWRRKIGITRQGFVYVSGNKSYSYDSNIPLIFIGGIPRSGTTLMRVMLDAHPKVQCGRETRVIEEILFTRINEDEISSESDFAEKIVDSAIASFILEVIVRHGQPAPRLCNKDPFTMIAAHYVSKIFPNSKFIFMVRDGRATVHSIISRNISITGFDCTSYRSCLHFWNWHTSLMVAQCEKVGPDRCLRVYYEQLVLNPREQMKRILNFMDLPWSESVLHHETFIGKPRGIVLSNEEMSTDQVMHPIYLKALDSWVGHIPEDVVKDMHLVAPMLKELGYDPTANLPDYGRLLKI